MKTVIENEAKPRLWSDNDPKQFEKVFTIDNTMHTTTDYDKFIYVGSNRANENAIDKERVKRLTDIYDSGKWLEGLQPIRINEQGIILDGHHVTEMFVRKGLPIEYLVIEKSFETRIEALDTLIKNNGVE